MTYSTRQPVDCAALTDSTMLMNAKWKVGFKVQVKSMPAFSPVFSFPSKSNKA